VSRCGILISSSESLPHVGSSAGALIPSFFFISVKPQPFVATGAGVVLLVVGMAIGFGTRARSVLSNPG